ncbi:hypothetical protein AAFP35_03345 [Gordonia sp. CPCC 206044]|uniref:hypothetical protein n=1 Tax=Gordonia sp. CPCC 206044 TaxID=3140793 RepID=UPI003AF34705
MTRRRALWIAVAAVVVVIAGVSLWHGRSTVHDREQGKSEATDRCTTAIRADIQDAFVTAGNTSDESTHLADAAEFADVRTRTTSISDDAKTLLRNAGHALTSVDVNWDVRGDVSIPGFARSGARYGPKNTFDCNAAVLDDGTVVLTDRRIN